ncbi:hypothetical protein HY496_02895 [Candidatus Woesearchaeota archaeon]|nr:hypothetical protein [Candidatus Woesearchaeota archaeon]
MAKATPDKKQASRVTVKKKSWFKIVAPPLFGQHEIGETYLEDPAQALGRKVEVNLKDLTNNLRDQSAYLVFSLTKTEGPVFQTEPIGYFLTSTHVKRLVRKNATRLDNYFVLHTKTGERVVFKTITITRSKVQRSVQKALHLKLKSLLQDELKKTDFSNFLSQLVSGRVRKTISALNKITPLRECAIRVMSLQGKGTPGEEFSSSEVDVESEESAGEEHDTASEEQNEEAEMS